MICPKCGIQNQEGRHFCPVCGSPLPKTTPLSSDPAEPAVPENAAGHEPRAATSSNSAGPVAEDLTGQTLDGKYQLLAKLGSGGMGTVYKARRLHIDDIIAIKVLHKELVSDQLAVERFRREAKAAARLKHPNAVNIYDSVVSPSGYVYMAMELAEGRSLDVLIHDLGFLPPKYAATIFTKVCAALDEAHRQNIVHRDLKPDNILVDTTKKELEVKVLDFGIAKLWDIPAESSTLTQKGMLLGTPMYMSPEQCLGEEIDGRSDIYSLGIILFEMLTGVVPFQSATPTAVIVQQVTRNPPSLRVINSNIPQGVENVVLHALEKRKEDRPQTAGALADELQAAVHEAAPQHSANTHGGNYHYTTHMDAPSLTQNRPVPVEKKSAFAQVENPSPVHTAKFASPQNSNSRRLVMLLLILLAGILVMASAVWLVKNFTGDPAPQTNRNEARTTQEKPAPESTKPAATPAPAPQPPAGMTYVSGGEFMMGRKDGVADEGPLHPITVRDFFIDMYEVTCEDYQKFLVATGHHPPSGWNGAGYPSGWARRPVDNIDWNDANAYAKWAGKRLPTEAEWEFAARGTDGRLYPWGNQWKAQAANAHTTSHHHPEPVGTHRAGASPFGVYDMVGNAWEWTASDFLAYPGGKLSDKPEKEAKVIRGGSCHSDGDEATTTFRKGLKPTDDDYEHVGFRCVKDVAAQ